MTIVVIDETGNINEEHSAYVVSTTDGMSFIEEGTNVTLKVYIENLNEDEECEYQWYISPNFGETWNLIDSANSNSYEYVFNYDTWRSSWKTVITIRQINHDEI